MNEAPSKVTRRSTLSVIGAASAAAGLTAIGRLATAGSPPARPSHVALAIDDALIVDEKGNVGIGKAPSADSLLDVGGKIKSLQLNVRNDALVVGDTGKVGIGTRDPQNDLEVGSFTTGRDVYIALRTQGANHAGIKLRHYYDDLGFTIDYVEQPPLVGLNILRLQGKNPVESALFISRETGAVGIGGKTDVLGARLQVAGNVKANRFIGSAAELTGPSTDANPKPKPLALAISGKNYLEFGAGIEGKEGDAGKIAYQAWSGGLDIVGAGKKSDLSDRKITLHAQGGLEVEGPIMLKDGQKIVDVIKCKNDKWNDATNELRMHFKQKLAGKPVGTLVFALGGVSPGHSWNQLLFFGWVRADGTRQMCHFQVSQGPAL